MRTSHGLTSLAPVLAIAGLAGFGATGYRMISGSCPFSCGGAACSVSLPTATITPAAVETDEESCPLCAEGHGEAPAAETPAAPEQTAEPSPVPSAPAGL